MKVQALLPAITLLLGCGAVTSDAVTAADAASIVRASLSNDLTYYTKAARTVCVQARLDPPLQHLRDRSGSNGSLLPNPHLAWFRRGKPLDPQLSTDLNVALSAAVARHGSELPITGVKSVPAPLILNPEHKSRKECERQGPREDNDPSTVSLTRPIVARGFAFLEQAYVCGGECGSGELQAFQKQNGRWVHVSTAMIWIS